MTQTHCLFHFQHILARVTLLVVLGILSMSTAFAAPPDLTANGVIATIDRSFTYNLGPTGLRGWIYVTKGSHTIGATGTMTGESRQILVTVASAPANAVLAVDDVILGAMAASSGTVPNFSSDARKSFAAAITAAEQTGGGTLRVKRWRAGTTTDVNIPITIMGNYTATAPYNCPKSALILANARNKLVAQMKADANFLSAYWDGAISSLALLAGVQPGDPDYATVQTRLQTHARNLAAAGPQEVGLPIWTWAYNTLFIAEYYLATGDAEVLPGIQSYTLKLARTQSIYGTYGHGPAYPRPDGSGRLIGTGYGPVNAAGIVANMAIVMGKKALLAGSQTVAPEITAAIQRGSDYFKFYVNKGSIPYGEHEPIPSWHASNGKDQMCAVLFGLQPGRATETEYFARMSIAGYNGREYGHTGQGFSYLWGALGANMGGALAVAEHLKPVRWHLDLSRRTDGSFAYDGQEQYGGGSTRDGTYLGVCGYDGLNPTASYILTYSLPLQRLYITGKRDAPANPPALNLDASTVAQAISAGNFQIDCPAFTTTSLISSLSNYDPVVRHFAAVELGKRSATITTAELTTLRSLLTGADANARMGAAQALGLLKDSTSLPTLAQRLNKTIEPDLWVRAKAASAIREYAPDSISNHRDAMLTAFVANGTDPDNIDWSDPIQTSNSYLSFALFGNAVYGGTDIAPYTISAPKNLLYQAVETGLKHPDSMPRSGISQFCFDRLPLADVRATLPAFLKAIEFECLADRMWHSDARVDGIATMTKYKISEGIPYALKMLEVAPGFEHGSPNTQIAGLEALANYGGAARWTLPKLKSYLAIWPPGPGENEARVYLALIRTIDSIESAISEPALNTGLAVAHSQVIPVKGAVAITLTGSSPRSSVTFTNLTKPANGTLTGTLPNLIYTPRPGYVGTDSFTFRVVDELGAAYPSAPATISLVVGNIGTGLKGEYFDNTDFTKPVLTRTDAEVNFDWGSGSPDASMDAETFSVRWSGMFLVPETGNYTFSALCSGGMRVYINGVLVLNHSDEVSTRWVDGTPIFLNQQQAADICIEYQKNSGNAVAKLKWIGPSGVDVNASIIPQAYLFDGSTIPKRPAFAFSQNLNTIKNTALPIILHGSGGSSLSYAVLKQPTNGMLKGKPPHLTYIPRADFTGTDSFTFAVSNGSNKSSPTTIMLGIQAGPLTHFNWNKATSGNLSDATCWAPGSPVAEGQPNYALNFNSPGTYTATLSNDFLLNQLIASAAVTLGGNHSLTFVPNGVAQPALHQSGSEILTVAASVKLSAITQFVSKGTGEVVLTKQITGTGGIVKNGPGKLCIYGADSNNFSGGTILNSGKLALGRYESTDPLGTGPVTLNGGDIEMERITASNPLTVNGGTLTSMNGFGAIWSGPVTLNQTLTTNCNWSLTFSGTVSGPAGIIKTRNNTLTLSAANSYTGTTEIREGTIQCDQNSALGSGPLIVKSAGKLNLNFTGTSKIAALTLDGKSMSRGTYGSSESNASYKNDTYFSGKGTVTVP